MGLQTPGLYVEIAGSTLNTYPYDLPGRPTWGSNIEQFAPYLERIGYCNLEVHPNKAIVSDVEAGASRGDTEAVETVVGSLHGTFNEGGDLFGKIADRKGVTRSLESIGNKGMYGVQRAISRPIPAVHYIREDGTRLPAHPIRIDPAYPGSFPIVQPTPEMYHGSNVEHWANEFFNGDRAQALGVVAGARDMVGLCGDNIHLCRRAADGSAIPDPEALWSELFASGRLYEAHIRADSWDMAKLDPALAKLSERDYAAFISGSWQRARRTQLADMIVAGIESYIPPSDWLQARGLPVLRGVVEIPPRLHVGAFLFRIAQQAQFVTNLAEIVREAGATPLLWGDKLPRPPDNISAEA